MINAPKISVPASTLIAFLCVACASSNVELLSDPKSWNGDFMRGAQPTATCPTDTIANARSRMSVDGPFTIEQYEQRDAYRFTVEEPDRIQAVSNTVSEFVRENIGEKDEIYDVSFYTDPSGGDFWGFSGYVVAREHCVIQVSKMLYIN